MADKNLLAVLHGKRNLRLEEREIPEPGPGDVQIRVQHVGICGTDLQLFEHASFNDKDITAPLAIGHESAGVISKIGEGVTTLKVGDKVAMDPVVGCMACSDCKKGKYNLCANVRLCGCGNVWGSMARYFVYKAVDCYRLPDHVSTEEGALLEPLTIAVHACRRGGIGLGDKVLVIGDGPIGLMSILAGKASGASQVCITGKHELRLAKAKEIGADFTINVTTNNPEDVVDMVTELLRGKPDFSIDTVGVQSGIETALLATHNGGSVILAGLREAKVTLPIFNTVLREVDIRGVAVNANCYPIALAMVASGEVNVKPLITHKFRLEDVDKAFAKAMSKDCMKVLVECSK